jgi:hypothetical protein
MRVGLLALGASYWEYHMDRDPRVKELANLKSALASFEHQLDAFEARAGYPSQAPQTQCLASTESHLASIDPQIAFANEVVAAMKNRLTEDRAMIGMRRGELS